MTPTRMKSPSAHKVAFSALLVVVILVTAFLMLLCLDFMIGRLHRESSLYPEKMAPTVFDMYPYSVGHMGANFVWENEIRIGQMGYWYPDFDFDKPPKKLPNEYRIILIGGSGAQGQGATIPNDTMLYRQIEHQLNKFGGNSKKTYRVINMAMGGSRTYHNSVDLNQFAHRLEPDLILTYSGFNDWVLATYFEYEPQLLTPEGCPVAKEVIRGDGTLVRLMPNLMYSIRYGFGVALRTSFPRHSLFSGARASIVEVAHCFSDKKQYFSDLVEPLYINSLKSIKRDFPGIPIMIAWQAIENAPDEFVSYGDPMRTIEPDFYNKMFEKAKAALTNYVDDKWIFLNVHKMLEDDHRLFGFHLTQEAQAIVGDVTAQGLLLNLDPGYAAEHPEIAKAMAEGTYKVEKGVAAVKIAGAPPEWSEEAYLYANSQVAKLLQEKKYESGWVFFRDRGNAEGLVEGSPLKWNERDYLTRNPDVAYFVRLGRYSSGYEHWVIAGRAEKRPGGQIK